MSGHSKWSTIKHKKALTDAKKSKIFSKMSALITVAARKGGDPEMNPTLRAAIEKAKGLNLSSDIIERAVKRGTGEIGGAQLEEAVYGAFGPGGVAILIKVITDNKNRTLPELKKILSDWEGKIVPVNSVEWLFERRGSDFEPKNPVTASGEVKEKLAKLYEALDEHEDVEEIYDNTGD